MAEYGIAPNTLAAGVILTLKFLLKPSKGRNQERDSVAIRDAMAGIRDLDTDLGKFSFDAVGDSAYNPIILFVENSKFETFE